MILCLNQVRTRIEQEIQLQRSLINAIPKITLCNDFVSIPKELIHNPFWDDNSDKSENNLQSDSSDTAEKVPILDAKFILNLLFSLVMIIQAHICYCRNSKSTEVTQDLLRQEISVTEEIEKSDKPDEEIEYLKAILSELQDISESQQKLDSPDSANLETPESP